MLPDRIFVRTLVQFRLIRASVVFVLSNKLKSKLP